MFKKKKSVSEISFFNLENSGLSIFLNQPVVTNVIKKIKNEKKIKKFPTQKK